MANINILIYYHLRDSDEMSTIPVQDGRKPHVALKNRNPETDRAYAYIKRHEHHAHIALSFHFEIHRATRNMLPSLLVLCNCFFAVHGRGSGFSPPFYLDQISLSPLHRGSFTSNQIRGRDLLGKFRYHISWGYW